MQSAARINVPAHVGWMLPRPLSTGGPDWPALFSCVLERSGGLIDINTVFVLVDDRDLTREVTPEESLSHWPSVAAWWKSRVMLTGPSNESCDLIFFPVGERRIRIVHLHGMWYRSWIML